MKQTYTISIVLSDAQIWHLRKLYGKNKNTGVKRLADIAIKRAVAESAKAELTKTGYAPVEDANGE
jgi:ribosomal protein S19E (S16A)